MLDQQMIQKKLYTDVRQERGSDREMLHDGIKLFAQAMTVLQKKTRAMKKLVDLDMSVPSFRNPARLGQGKKHSFSTLRLKIILLIHVLQQVGQQAAQHGLRLRTVTFKVIMRQKIHDPIFSIIIVRYGLISYLCNLSKKIVIVKK